MEQKYNCSIRQDTTATFWDTAREPLMAGEYTYDVFYSNFTTVPQPKRNAEQEEYYTVQEAAITSSYFIPITVDKISEAQAAGFESGREMVGYFLNAMSYESRDTLIPAFYEQVVKRQMVQNQETADMVDLAVKNKVIDPVVFYDFGTMQKIFRDAGCGDGYGGTGGNKNGAVGSDAKYDTLTSLYEQRLSSARTALNNYLKAIEAAGTATGGQS